MKKVIIFAKNKKTGENFQFSLDDLYGYEGEVCGVFIGETGMPLNFNSGYGSDGMNSEIEILDAKTVED